MKLGAGALSDDKVVAAAEEFGRVIIYSHENPDLFGKHGVRSMPTILFLDYEGREVGRLGSRKPEDVVRQFKDVFEKHVRGPKWASDAASALAAGKKDGKPVALLYRDDGSKSADFLKVFRDASFTPEFFEKFAFVKVTFDAKSEDAKNRDVKEAPTLVILDATGEGEPKVLDRVTAAEVDSIRKALEAAAEEIERK